MRRAPWCLAEPYSRLSGACQERSLKRGLVHTVVVVKLRSRVGGSGHAECDGKELLANDPAEDTVPQLTVLLEGYTSL